MLLMSIEVIMIIVLVGVPMSLLAILIITRVNASYEQPAGVKFVERSWTEIPGAYRLELINTENGIKIQKWFVGRLIIGRRIDQAEPAGLMYLESDPTISRNQMRLTDTSEGMIIENMSQVNITKLNGRFLDRPALLHIGDFIGTGRCQYLVADLKKTA